MKKTFNELITYLKNPVLAKDKNTNISYRVEKFVHLFLISVATAIILMLPLMLIEEMGWVNMDNHAMSKLMEENSYGMILFLAVIIAPLFEELFFRAPLTLFKNGFKYAFFILAVIFGLIHILNFEMTTNVMLLAPVLILPQTILGGYLGFIRVRFGLEWSILLHACYNLFFVGISLIGEQFI